MDQSKRRRSSRLRKIQREDIDDDTKSIGGGNANGTSSERNPNATVQTRASQSLGCRRARSNSSDSESLFLMATNKRRKRTAVSKTKLSISTNANESTTITNRRRTRSFSKQIQTKNVTPSPVPSSASSKFIFSSTRKATHRRRGIHGGIDCDDDSRKDFPPEVVNLYRDQENDIRTSSADFESPTNLRSRKRRTLTRQEKQQQEQTEHLRRPMVLTMGDPFSSSLNPESMTINYIRTYGEDYWQFLHDSELPIICDPSTLKSSNEISKGKSNTEATNSGKSNSKRGGSPASRRSSSSESMCTSTSNVTPNDRSNRKYSSKKAWVATDFNWIKEKKNPQPHQSQENTKTMSIQPQLTPKMRSILIDWLIELSEHFSFGPSTLHLAVTMVDRVLASGRFMEQENSSSCSTKRKSPRSCSKAAISTNPAYDSDSYFNESDDESYFDENEDDNKSKDTRCYIIPRDRFQLLGATCVWLACKVEETTPPKAREIAYVSDHIYSIEQITLMERRVCNALNFTFFEIPTPHQFLFEFMRASLAGFVPEQQDHRWSAKNNACSPTCVIPAAATGVQFATHSVFRDMSHYLLELGRLPYGPTGRNPSLLAAAAVYLARVTLGIPRALKDIAESGSARSVSTYSSCLASSSDSDSDSSLDPFLYYWTPTLKYYTGYTQSDLRNTVTEIHEYHMAAESSALKAVFNKFKSKK